MVFLLLRVVGLPESLADFEHAVEFGFQQEFLLALPVAVRVVPEGQLLLQFFVLVVFDFVELQIPKFAIQLIDVLDLLRLLSVPAQQRLVRTLDLLHRPRLSHTINLNYKPIRGGDWGGRAQQAKGGIANKITAWGL